MCGRVVLCCVVVSSSCASYDASYDVSCDGSYDVSDGVSALASYDVAFASYARAACACLGDDVVALWRAGAVVLCCGVVVDVAFASDDRAGFVGVCCVVVVVLWCAGVDVLLCA